MNQDEFIKIINKRCPELAPELIGQALSLFFQKIQSSLIEGRRVEIRRFGIFSIHHRSARKARNPGTGQTINLAQRKYLRFKISKNLLKGIN